MEQVNSCSNCSIITKAANAKNELMRCLNDQCIYLQRNVENANIYVDELMLKLTELDKDDLSETQSNSTESETDNSDSDSASEPAAKRQKVSNENALDLKRQLNDLHCTVAVVNNEYLKLHLDVIQKRLDNLDNQIKFKTEKTEIWTTIKSKFSELLQEGQDLKIVAAELQKQVNDAEKKYKALKKYKDLDLSELQSSVRSIKRQINNFEISKGKEKNHRPDCPNVPEMK